MDERDDLPRVLVVDDESGPRLSLSYLLASRYRVESAASGFEALERLGQEPFDAITLDLRMPGMNGIETFGHIRKRDAEVEVVIVSALPPFETASQCLQLRAFDYLTKPFRQADVLATLERAIASRTARRLPPGPSTIAALAGELLEQLDVLAPADDDRAPARQARMLARCIQSLSQPHSEVRLIRAAPADAGE